MTKSIHMFDKASFDSDYTTGYTFQITKKQKKVVE